MELYRSCAAPVHSGDVKSGKIHISCGFPDRSSDADPRILAVYHHAHLCIYRPVRRHHGAIFTASPRRLKLRRQPVSILPRFGEDHRRIVLLLRRTRAEQDSYVSEIRRSVFEKSANFRLVVLHTHPVRPWFSLNPVVSHLNRRSLGMNQLETEVRSQFDETSLPHRSKPKVICRHRREREIFRQCRQFPGRIRAGRENLAPEFVDPSVRDLRRIKRNPTSARRPDFRRRDHHPGAQRIRRRMPAPAQHDQKRGRPSHATFLAQPRSSGRGYDR